MKSTEKIILIALKRIMTFEEKKKIVGNSFEDFYKEISNNKKFKSISFGEGFWKQIYDEFKKETKQVKIK